MKTRILLALLSFMFITPAFSQAHKHTGKGHKKTEKCNPAELRKKIETQKIGYITKELELTEVEAQKFWPIYNSYEKEMMTVREDMRSKMKELKKDKEEGEHKRLEFLNMKEDEAHVFLNTHLEYEKKLLDIQSKYIKEFEKAIPVQKVAKFYHSEKKFMARLLRGNGGNKANINKKNNHKGCPVNKSNNKK